MGGEVANRVRELMRQGCREEDTAILKGHVSKDAWGFAGIHAAAGEYESAGAKAEREEQSSPAK